MTDNTELLSDTENTNKELNEVFNLLASNVAPLKEKNPNKLTWREKALGLGNTIISILSNSIAPTILERILFFGFIVFMLAAIVLLIISTTPSKIVYFFIGFVFFILFMLVNTIKLIIKTITQWESSEKIINKKLNKLEKILLMSNN